jgi:hypothetical protein
LYDKKVQLLAVVSIIDISKKDWRAENPYPWNVSTRVSDQGSSISGDV